MYWTTRDGRKLKIEEMETDHIAACIRMMDKKCSYQIIIEDYGVDECYFSETPEYKAMIKELVLRNAK